jgi:hypothetical protein
LSGIEAAAVDDGRAVNGGELVERARLAARAPERGAQAAATRARSPPRLAFQRREVRTARPRAHLGIEHAAGALAEGAVVVVARADGGEDPVADADLLLREVAGVHDLDEPLVDRRLVARRR